LGWDHVQGGGSRSRAVRLGRTIVEGGTPVNVSCYQAAWGLRT